jgi:hypothetical protein
MTPRARRRRKESRPEEFVQIYLPTVYQLVRVFEDSENRAYGQSCVRVNCVQAVIIRARVWHV